MCHERASLRASESSGTVLGSMVHLLRRDHGASRQGAPVSDGGIDELMSQIPIGQLAGQLGVSEAEAEQAVRTALPALLGGMQANAQDPAGEASLAQALS